MKPTTRRRWIRSCLPVAALSGLTPSSLAASNTCSLGIGTYGLQSLPLEKALRLIADTGFDTAEITAFPGSTGEPANLDSTRRRTLRQLLVDQNLPPCALMVDLKPSSKPSAQEENRERLRQLLQLAHDLSPTAPPLLQTVLGGKVWEDSKSMFLKELETWVPLCEQAGVPLGIKPHRGNAMSQPANAIWLFKELGSNPWLRMVYDYSHYAFRDLPIANTIEEALPWTSYVAVKDARQIEGKVQFALAGSTESWDQAEVVGGFQRGGYRGAFCCEVSSQIWRKDPSYDPVAATRTCYKNMAAAFKRAGVSRP